MLRVLRLSLSTKFLLAMLLAVLPNAILLMRHAEEQLEDTLLDQVKKQAIIYLQGVGRELQRRDDPLEPVGLQAHLKGLMSAPRQAELDFSVRLYYVFDASGQVLAEAGVGQHPPVGVHKVDMQGFHRQVLDSGAPFVSPEVEYEADSHGQAVPVIDVMVPMRVGERLVVLEAELDLIKTQSLIKQTDNQYERELALLIGVHAVVLFVMLLWLVHRLLIRPIRGYERTTRAIAGGDLEHRIPVPLPSDEIGHLGGAINVMADSIVRLLREQEEAYLQTLQSLLKALEAKDAYTSKHSARVARYSVLLGQALGLPEEELELLRKGALMHDLGKIGIADAILNKPSRLTEEEFAEMRKHPTHTAAIMRPLKRFKAFTDIAAWHHEHWDGRGYPDGLQGEQIPLLARIVSIADTWDAMTGDRVYRQGMPRAKAIAILEAERWQGQWDPELVGVFVALLMQDPPAGESGAPPPAASPGV